MKDVTVRWCFHDLATFDTSNSKIFPIVSLRNTETVLKNSSIADAAFSPKSTSLRGDASNSSSGPKKLF